MNENKKKQISFKDIAIVAIKIIVVSILLYFVYKQLHSSWNDAINFKWKINVYLLFLSVILHLLTFVLFSKIWCILIKAFGFNVQLKYAFKISYIANLGRYIPGKIWPVIGMSLLAEKLKITKEAAVTSWITAMIFALPSAFLAGSLCIMFSPEILDNEIISGMGIGFYLTIGFFFFISIALIIVPNQTIGLINLLLKRLKRSQINFQINIKTAFWVYFGYSICWLCYGFAFWLFIVSVTSNYDLPIMPTIGAFILAYQIGYLAFFAPGGIGVRELVLTGILVPYLGPIAAGVSVAARLWNLIVEIIATIIALKIKIPSK